MRCASAASVSSPGSATRLRGRDARALARPVSPFPPRRHRRGAARFASKGDDGSSASPGSSDASPPEGPSFAEAREKFKRDFWDEVANDPGGVPFLKPRDGRGGPRRGDPGAKEGGATEETSEGNEKRAHPESGAGTTSGRDRRRESFWSRCTLAGLALGVWFGVWGLTSMHWPTVAWTAKHPRALAWSVDLGWSVLAEVARRLAAPALRLLAAWFAMRSRWALALVAAVGAFAAPGVEA
jgi:hypothetical protein